MRGPARWLFHIFSILSLMLFVLGTGAWYRSYEHHDEVYYESTSINVGCISELGVLAIGGVIHNPNDNPRGFQYLNKSSNFNQTQFRDLCDFYWMGFGGGWGTTIPAVAGYKAYIVTIPYGFLVLVLGSEPALWLIWWRRRRRRGPNACDKCAYDLTGNTTGICPECGAPVELPFASPTSL